MAQLLSVNVLYAYAAIPICKSENKMLQLYSFLMLQKIKKVKKIKIKCMWLTIEMSGGQYETLPVNTMSPH